jgi:hypothetical protein
MRVERSSLNQVVGERQGIGVSGYRVTVTGVANGSSASNITFVSQPLAGMFDGGKSWEALMSLESRVQATCTTGADSL